MPYRLKVDSAKPIPMVVIIMFRTPVVLAEWLGHPDCRRLAATGVGESISVMREWIKEKHLPPKIRELISDLKRAGFVDKGGKGSHRNFVHPKASKPITISGKLGEDAKGYQIKAVQKAIEESKK